MAIDIGREAEELARYYSELVRRLPQNGVRDVPELIALFDQLRAALDAIGGQEIAWASEQAERLVQELVRIDTSLQALRRLKAHLDLGAAGGGPSPRRAP